MSLEKIKSPTVANVEEGNGCLECIEATADSRATDTVGNESIAPWLSVKPTRASEAGVQYNAADGGIINNLGGKSIDVVNDTFAPGNIAVQICDKVNKFLAAVSQIGKTGNKNIG